MDFAHIGHVSLGQRSDPGRAEGHQDRRGVGGITLKVSVQSFFRQGDGHFVVGAGKVIQADLNIAVMLDQTGAGFFVLAPSLGGVGQGFRRDQPLVLLHPRHVGIAEQGDALRLERHGAVYGVQQSVQGLIGQAVNQIHVDFGNVEPAQPVDGLGGDFIGLDAIDGFLNLGIEILHPQRGAGHPSPLHGGDVDFRRRPGVQFDGDFGIGLDQEAVAQGVDGADEILGVQNGRRSAAEMDVPHRHASRQSLGDQIHLAHDCLHIGFDGGVAARDLGMASAEPAHFGAIGDVQVQRQFRRGVQFGQPLAVHRGIDAGMKVGGGGIGRIAWNA